MVNDSPSWIWMSAAVLLMNTTPARTSGMTPPLVAALSWTRTGLTVSALSAHVTVCTVPIPAVLMVEVSSAARTSSGRRRNWIGTTFWNLPAAPLRNDVSNDTFSGSSGSGRIMLLSIWRAPSGRTFQITGVLESPCSNLRALSKASTSAASASMHASGVCPWTISA
jgi:hypothetical protein